VIRSEKLKPEKVTSFLVFLSSVKSDDGYQIGLRVLACVASVSVGLSAGLKHFSLFEHAKIWASAKTPFPLLPLVLRSPQFPRRQKAKNASNGRKNLRNACYAG